MNRFKNAVILGCVMAAVIAWAGCSKNKDDAPSGSHKVVFKAIGSAGVNIEIAVYTIGSTPTSATGLSGSTWTSSEITVKASERYINFGVEGTGPNASSTLRVETWVDGVKVKENTSTGTVLTPQTGVYEL